MDPPLESSNKPELFNKISRLEDEVKSLKSSVSNMESMMKQMMSMMANSKNLPSQKPISKPPSIDEIGN